MLTPNAKWSLAVCEEDHGFCAARLHDPRCRGIGHHAHHMNYKSRIPKYCYWIVKNGIWLSIWCHDLAHRTNNASLPVERVNIGTREVNAVILRRDPGKPELLIKPVAA